MAGKEKYSPSQPPNMDTLSQLFAQTAFVRAEEKTMPRDRVEFGD
jgi:hypothetical protein